MTSSYLRVAIHPGCSALILITFLLSGCAVFPRHRSYQGPPTRPSSLIQYYDYKTEFTDYTEVVIKERERHRLVQIELNTEFGTTRIDYYEYDQPSDHLIFVFPVLGGKPLMSTYFADYFVRMGFDAAIVHRDNEFKDPANVDRLEELFRNGTIRDRLALDFFEQKKGKKRFGSFGISRGAINVAITAGVDPRLQYNIMALGGTDLTRIFESSRERRIRKYVKEVSASKGISKKSFIKQLSEDLVSDPINVAHYIDANKTLLFLALCDTTVPLRYGHKLRDQIGHPETVFLAAGHKTSALFTQYAKILMPLEEFCYFPFDYIEIESLAFFNRHFRGINFSLRLLPFRILQAPLNLFSWTAGTIAGLFHDEAILQEKYLHDIWQQPERIPKLTLESPQAP